MKTFKDLKIDDTVYIVHGYEIKLNKVLSLNANHYSIQCTSNHTNIPWENLKDLTYTQSYYTLYYIYCNQSEAIMKIKERLCDDINEQVNKINKEMLSLIDLKDKLVKYL